MKHLDLFSGIGGFALATEWAWPDDEVEHIFCDNDPFSQAVLKKHWPNSLIYGDIKELTAGRIATDTRREYGESWSSESTLREASERSGTTEEVERHTGIDLLTGGFPCQPFSAAGRRRGTEDDRHLWPEMLRLIRETNPTYVLGENVGGFLTWDGGLVFQQVCTDLEEAGYEVCPLVIPACALNAPHRRDRVWIAAHAKSSNARRTPRTIQSTEGTQRLRERDYLAESSKPSEAWVSSDPKHARRNGTENRESSTTRGNSDQTRTHEDEQFTRSVMARDDASDNTSTGRKQQSKEQAERQCAGLDRERSNQRTAWTENWPEVAARLCTLDDGLPNGLVRPKGWRNAALKGAGNAIVPQVATEILRAMKTI